MLDREYLNLIGQDPDEDLVDDDTYRMAVMDRLREYEPSNHLALPSATPPVSPPSGGTRDTTGRQPKACDICVEQIPERVRRRYRREHMDERRAAAVLYGAATRSGSVTDVAPIGTPIKAEHSFQYEHTDVPPGMRLCDWSPDTIAAPAADTAEAA